MATQRSAPPTAGEIAWTELGLPSGFPGKTEATEEVLRILRGDWRETLVLLHAVASLLGEVAGEGAPIRNVKLDLVQDLEVPEWTELVLMAELDAPPEDTLTWWRKASERRAALNRALSPRDRDLLGHRVGLALVPIL